MLPPGSCGDDCAWRFLPPSVPDTSRRRWLISPDYPLLQIPALAFVAIVEDPGRFRTANSIGSYIGLTPKRYQSGDRVVTGSISKQGDEMLQHLRKA
ncbi:transposase [Agrobacterium tumefaciens]|uniref:transposase n=1 Tax=Agrobacterium tumefaciens TaxID=358 RepID=UPI001572D1B3